ncbi:MAG: secondary thiamine-phosphate synthase enzyme YjbQ, partial [bacterium]
MRLATKTIVIDTSRAGLHEFADTVREFVQAAEIKTGLLTLFVQHTSASLLIQENADPEVCRDLERFFQRLVPYGDPLFRHTSEGPDDMPAHVRAALTATSLTIPIQNGKPTLGIWQGIYLYEHRTSPHRRQVVLQ